jgi:hypothetical protein
VKRKKAKVAATGIRFKISYLPDGFAQTITHTSGTVNSQKQNAHGFAIDSAEARPYPEKAGLFLIQD